MAARQNLILTDRATTPANHTFVPSGDKGDVHIFEEKTEVAAGNPNFTISLRKGTSRFTAVIRMAIPVVQTQVINGISNPVVVRTTYIDFKVTYADTSLLQERKDAIGMFTSSLGASQTQVDDLLTKLTDMW